MPQVYKTYNKKMEKKEEPKVKDSRGKDKPYRDAPEYNRFLTRPTTTAPSSLMSRIAQPLMESGEQGDGMMDKAKLYGGAFLQSFGDRISEATSPLSAAMAGFGMGGAGSIGDKLLSAIGRKVMNRIAPQMDNMPPLTHGRADAFRNMGSLDDIFSRRVNLVDPKNPNLIHGPGGARLNKAPKKQFHKYSENLNDSRNGWGQAFRIDER